jgi:hypothetical protein
VWPYSRICAPADYKADLAIHHHYFFFVFNGFTLQYLKVFYVGFPSCNLRQLAPWGLVKAQ